MIIGIGIDSVEIIRFMHWHTKSHTSLRRIFSDEEIAYCMQDHNKSAERFAVRFAAREAFYKALSFFSPFTKASPSFLRIAATIKILKHDTGKPFIIIDWDSILGISCLDITITSSIWHISLTHTKTVATAVVIGENLSGSAKLI